MMNFIQFRACVAIVLAFCGCFFRARATVNTPNENLQESHRNKLNELLVRRAGLYLQESDINDKFPEIKIPYPQLRAQIKETDTQINKVRNDIERLN